MKNRFLCFTILASCLSSTIVTKFDELTLIKGVHHTSIINWVKQVGELLPDAYEPETIPLVGELDELETFVGQKK